MKKTLFGVLLFITCTGASSAEPCVPTLEIVKETPTTVTLKWNCNHTEVSSNIEYSIRYKIYDGHSKKQLVSVNLPNPNLNTYILKNLNTCDVRYAIHMRISDKIMKTSERSNEVYTIGCVGSFDRFRLEIVNTTLTSATLKWDYYPGRESEFTGFEILDGDYESVVQIPDPNIYMYTMKNLTCGKSYTWSVSYVGLADGITNRVQIIIEERLEYPATEEFLEVDDTSVTLRLDLVKTVCPVRPEKFYYDFDTERPYFRNDTGTSTKPFVLSNLKPNTQYELIVTEDVSKRGSIFAFKTLCVKAPDNPTKTDVLEERDTSLVVRLYQFSDCFTSFDVEYRESDAEQWEVQLKDIKPKQESLLIQQLTAGATYKLKITGHFKHGDSIAEYDFSPKKHACGEWTQYNKKCIIPVKEAGLLPKKDALLVCQRMQENVDIPSLLTITNKLEMEYIQNMLRDEHVDDVWLGLHIGNGGTYRWDDGSKVEYSNWNNQSASEDEMHCGKLNIPSRRSEKSGWEKTDCQSRTYVVCEKPQPLPVGKIHQEVVKVEKRLTAIIVEATEKFENIERRLLQAEQKLSDLKQINKAT